MGVLSTRRDSQRQPLTDRLVLLDFWSITKSIWLWHAAGLRSTEEIMLVNAAHCKAVWEAGWVDVADL